MMNIGYYIIHRDPIFFAVAPVYVTYLFRSEGPKPVVKRQVCIESVPDKEGHTPRGRNCFLWIIWQYNIR